MKSGRKSSRLNLRIISISLVIAFTFTWAVPSDTSSAYQRVQAPCNLATQGGYVDGIDHEEDVIRSEKAMLIVTTQYVLRKHPDILLSIGNPAANSFRQLHRRKEDRG